MHMISFIVEMAMSQSTILVTMSIAEIFLLVWFNGLLSFTEKKIKQENQEA